MSTTTTGPPWQPIESYPRTLDPGPGAWWGPEVLVRLPEQKTHFSRPGVPTGEITVEPLKYVAHLEAGEWLTRSGDDPLSWCALSAKPTHWAPLPTDPVEVPESLDVDEAAEFIRNVIRDRGGDPDTACPGLCQDRWKAWNPGSQNIQDRTGEKPTMSDSSTTPDYRDILLKLIGSLTFADHMGDVSDDVAAALKMAGITIEWEDWDDLGSALHKMGVTTLFGSSLSSEDENDEP